MESIKKSKIYIISIAAIFLCSFTLTSLGEEKIIPKTKKMLKTSKPTPAIQKGSIRVTVPNLIGKTEVQAKKEIKKLGLKVGKIQYQMIGLSKPNTVVKQKPKSKTKVAKGSKVELWIKREATLIKGKTSPKVLKGGKKVYPHSKPSGKKITPKIKKQGKNTFAIFPETVQNVKVKDTKGRILQKFRKKGKRFNITQSIAMVKGGKIKITFIPTSGLGSPRKLPPLPYEFNFNPQPDIDHNIERVTPRGLDTGTNIQKVRINRNYIDLNEPGNNRIDDNPSSILGGAMNYSGVVGGENDPVDFIEYINVIDQHVSVGVLSGNVKLRLYSPKKTMLEPPTSDPYYDSQFWIAIKESTKFYFSVEPKDSGPTNYVISVLPKPIHDRYEPNDSYLTSSGMIKGQWNKAGRFTGIMDKHGNTVHFEDYFRVILAKPMALRISVRNANLSYGKLYIEFFDCQFPRNSEKHKYSARGNKNGVVLWADLRPNYDSNDDPDFNRNSRRYFYLTCHSTWGSNVNTFSLRPYGYEKKSDRTTRYFGPEYEIKIEVFD